jgi:hypothetical protein
MGINNQLPSSRLAQPGVIDNAAARPAAPYEGTLIFQKDTDQLLVWNGTAWVIPNSPAQNPQGLELVKTQTIGSGVTSQLVSNCFSSTYDDYKIRITGGLASSVGFLAFQLNNSSTNYFAGYAGSTYLAGAYVGDFNNNASKWTIAGGHTTVVLTMNMDLWQPFNTKPTWMQTGVMFLSNAYGTAAGENTPATSHTGFIITPQSGTLTGGTITVYGYRKA